MSLTKTDARNLLIFLSRADLKGSESPTFLALCQKVQAIVDTPDTAPVPEITELAE